MPNDSYEKLPRVEFSVDMGDFEQAKMAAQQMEALGVPGAMAEYEREFRRAKAAESFKY